MTWLPTGSCCPGQESCLSRCPASVFQDKMLFHWTSQVVLVWTQMLEFSVPEILDFARKVPVTIQRAAASRSSILVGMQPGR